MKASLSDSPDTKSGWITKCLLLLILCLFGVGGVISGVSKSKKYADAVIEVGGVTITKGDYDRLYGREVEYIRQVTGGSMSEADMIKIGLRANVLRELEDQALSLNFAQQLGLRVGDNVIFENIHNNPAFFGDSGTFDEHKFREILKNNGYSEVAYVKRLSEAVVQNSLMSIISKQELALSGAASEYYKHRFRARVVDIVKFNGRSLANKRVISDKEIVEYYEKNLSSYATPEKRKVKYVSIGAADVTSSASVSDDEIKAALEKLGTNEEERRDVISIVLPSYAEAVALRKKIVSGGLSSAMEGRQYEVLQLSALDRPELPPNFANAIFSLTKPGDVSEPFLSPFGWHIAQLKRVFKRPAREVEAEMRKVLLKEKASSALYDIIGQMEDERNKGTPVDSIALAHELKVIETGYFSPSQDSDDVDGDYPSTAPASMARAAFGQTKNGGQATKEQPVKSEFIYDSATSRYFLFEVTGSEEGHTRPLSEVRKSIEAQLALDFQAEGLRAVAQRTRDSLMAQGNCYNKAAAAALGGSGSYLPKKLVYRSAVASKVDALASNYPVELIDQIFLLKGEGDITNVVSDEDGNAMFAVFRGIHEAPEDNAPYKDSIKSELNNSYHESLYRGTMEFLRSKYKIRRNVEHILG